MSINYLLHESPVGYAVFEVISQPDTIGSRLKEVQNSIEVSEIESELWRIRQAERV